MDYLHYIRPTALLPALVACLFPCMAAAGMVTNLSDRQHVVEIQTSNGYIPQAVAPGHSVHIYGGARMKFEGREFYLPHDMEYAIWQDGSFGPQRRIKRSRR